jgi:hypothetical protein
MKYSAWNVDRTATPFQERGISFEEIVFHIENGDVLDLLEHPNRNRYTDQRVFIVNVEGSPYSPEARSSRGHPLPDSGGQRASQACVRTVS